MDKFLGQKIRFVTIVFLSAITVYVILSAGTVQAVNRTATMTGYVFRYATPTATGKPTNLPGYFANHSTFFCPGDPAASWATNTQITMVSPSSVPFRFSDNSAYSRTSFNLQEKGDSNCLKSNYWADIYFGHVKENPSTNCNCITPLTLSCVAGTNGVNNCDQAKSWGGSNRTYNGP